MKTWRTVYLPTIVRPTQQSLPLPRAAQQVARRAIFDNFPNVSLHSFPMLYLKVIHSHGLFPHAVSIQKIGWGEEYADRQFETISDSHLKRVKELADERTCAMPRVLRRPQCYYSSEMNKNRRWMEFIGCTPEK